MAEPKVALLVAGAQEEVPAQQLFVERGCGSFDRQPAADVTGFFALLELLEMHRVVHIGDEDAVGVRDERSADQYPPLEDEHIAPLDQLPKLRRAARTDAKAL